MKMKISRIRNESYQFGQRQSVLDEEEVSWRPAHLSTTLLTCFATHVITCHVITYHVTCLQVRGGSQSTYQLFVTNSAHIFLISPPINAPKLVEEQVTIH